MSTSLWELPWQLTYAINSSLPEFHFFIGLDNFQFILFWHSRRQFCFDLLDCFDKFFTDIQTGRSNNISSHSGCFGLQSICLRCGDHACVLCCENQNTLSVSDSKFRQNSLQYIVFHTPRISTENYTRRNGEDRTISNKSGKFGQDYSKHVPCTYLESIMPCWYPSPYTAPTVTTIREYLKTLAKSRARSPHVAFVAGTTLVVGTACGGFVAVAVTLSLAELRYRCSCSFRFQFFTSTTSLERSSRVWWIDRDNIIVSWIACQMERFYRLFRKSKIIHAHANNVVNPCQHSSCACPTEWIEHSRET